MANTEPTTPQAETLGHIRDFINTKGYSPTIAELAKLAGIRGFAMQNRIEGLERKKLITRTARIARSIRPA
ncbi:hypothetical protein F3I16_15890 [Pseudomonas sp. L-22-4S-12]|uniref:LexA family protein n=1 Tax=Pseudomonas sp. L-22-4S-12 TaxID=2610893 RepID=UPI0013250222|nr:hypothetical protein [Pseudomonas sp. L-22-4S-12]MWV17523.1 hypothetical protein [Pseudomonas sp. L-22-4S-12]